MKAFKNLIFLIILSISLYVLPLNTEVFDFSSSEILDSDEKVKKSDVFESDCIFSRDESKSYLNSPKSYEFKFVSNHDLPSDFKDELDFSFEFLDSNESKVIFNKKDLKFDISSSENEMNVNIDMSDLLSKLDYTTYSAKLEISCYDRKFEDKFVLFNAKENIKLQDNLSESNRELGALYYNDKDLKYSIPIYREIVFKRNKFTSVLYSIAHDSDKIKEAVLSPCPVGEDSIVNPYVWYSKGKLRWILSEGNIKNIENEKEAELFIENIINSFKSNPQNYIINDMVFEIIGGVKKDIAGFSIENSFKVDRNAAIYLPMFYNEDSYYWVPFDFEISEDISSDLNNIFEYYTISKEKTEDKRFVSLLPRIKYYERITFVDKKLQIEISDEMLEFLESNQNYAEMLKESLAISLATIDGVDKYEFSHDDRLLENIGEVEFGANIKPPQYFNKID